MPTYEFQYNNKTFQIQAPDENKAIQAFKSNRDSFIPPEGSIASLPSEDDKYKGLDDFFNNLGKTLGLEGSEFKVPRPPSLIPEEVKRTALKGIPILGRFVPDTKESKQFEEQRPMASGATQLAGGSVATAPMMPLKLGQAMMTAMGMGVGDTIADKGGDVTEGDIVGAGVISPLLAALGPMGKKIISPTVTNELDTVLGKMWWGHKPTAKAVSDEIKEEIKGKIGRGMERIISGGVGAAAGSLAGFPVLGAIAGIMKPEAVRFITRSAPGRYAQDLLVKYYSNQSMAPSIRRRLLNSIAANMGISTAELTRGLGEED